MRSIQTELVFVLRREENQRTEKISRSKEGVRNKLNPHEAISIGIELKRQRLEVTAYLLTM